MLLICVSVYVSTILNDKKGNVVIVVVVEEVEDCKKRSRQAPKRV